MSTTKNNHNKHQPSIYIVTGGHGFTGNFIVQSVLAQFPRNRIDIVLKEDVNSIKKMEKAVREGIDAGAIIVHTLVDQGMRERLKKLCLENNCRNIDLMGDLIDIISEDLGEEPLNQPGLFRKANTEYFDRLESIDFTIRHDDGLNIENIRNADIVLTGVSRTGKTPLSMYLAMLGWKVANVPIIRGFTPNPVLFEVDSLRVFGLKISTTQLLTHRKKRLHLYDKLSETDYINPRKIREELEYARSVFLRGNFTVVDVSNKAIESIANDILRHLTKRFDKADRRIKLPTGYLRKSTRKG